MATSRSSAAASRTPSRSRPSPSQAERTLRASGFVKIGDHFLYWEMHGPRHGPLLVLLHHGLGSIRSWRKQLPFFAAGGWRLLAFDRWGYGRSDARPFFGAEFMQQDAEEALALLQYLKVERASFLGHSDGGTIGIMLAANHPRLVERLVLVAAHIYWEPKTMASIKSIRNQADDPTMIRGWQREHGEKGPALVKCWADGWLREEMKALDLRNDLPRIACPTLVIQGEGDEYATPAQAHDISAGIASADLWVVPDVGHMPMLEIPGPFNSKVSAFLGASD